MAQTAPETKTKKRGLRELPIIGALLGLLAMAMPASASNFVINDTIGQIIGEVVLIIPDLLDLVLEMLPIVIVISIVGFLVAFFDKILGMFKI